MKEQALIEQKNQNELYLKEAEHQMSEIRMVENQIKALKNQLNRLQDNSDVNQEIILNKQLDNSKEKVRELVQTLEKLKLEEKELK